MQTLRELNEECFDALRKEVSRYIGDRRLSHTLGVEKMALTMGELLLPEKKNELSAAALLHDITKECSDKEQLALCCRYGIHLSPEEKKAVKTLHAKTGAYFAREQFPFLVTDEIMTAIARHTTGAYAMSVFDEIIFLADLIEDGRMYPISINLRREFFDNISKSTSVDERTKVLHKVVFEALSATILHLIQGRSYIAPDTVAAYNFLKSKIEV